jgi:lycopene beta-cyclase
MNGRDCDIAIVGGGLAGGLIALALAKQRPEVTVRLFEAGPSVGGQHRWSWFSRDMSREGKLLMRNFSVTRWNDGYDVRFPGDRQTLDTRYRSLSSDDFAAGLAAALRAGTVRTNCPVEAFDANGVTLKGGERVTAGAVIDCRGFAPTPHLTGGWQVFHGQYVRTEGNHGVKRPMIMDASVGQTDSYRFVYLLPIGDRELLMEETYYQAHPRVDEEALTRRLGRYAGKKYWKYEVQRVETGVLPIIAGGDFEAWQDERRIAGVARAGTHAGFLHPLTGYTLPFAVESALAVGRQADLSGPALAAMLEQRARAHWRTTRFYRRLATIVFGGARPSKRWKLFARFYDLPEPLIERFYAARSTRRDRLRILCGKPPVSPLRAVRALLTARTPLTSDA